MSNLATTDYTLIAADNSLASTYISEEHYVLLLELEMMLTKRNIIHNIYF